MSVTVVTGAAGGIGRAVVRRLVGGGHDVLAVDLASSSLDELSGPSVRTLALDVAQREAADTVAADAGGDIDGFVHAAGNTRNGPVTELSDEAWDSVLEVHLGSAFRLTRALGSRMTAGSSVVLVSSTSIWGSRYMANYAAAKAGMLGLARTLAIELGPIGVRANLVALGAIDTPMLRSGPPEWLARLPRRIPLGRIGNPDEAAGAIAFLLGPDAGFVTGSCLVVDGGYRLGG